MLSFKTIFSYTGPWVGDGNYNYEVSEEQIHVAQWAYEWP